MPAHQLVDVDVHADIGVLLQVADMGMVVIGAAVDQPQFLIAEQQRAVADVRILHDAALEACRAGSPERISPTRSRRAALRNVCPPAGASIACSPISVTSPMITALPATMPMNFPTVGCSPPALRALSSTVACEPETATTRPIKSVSARAGVWA